MLPIRIVAIPTEVAKAVRATLRAPVYGFPAHAEVATDAAPCRHCLRTFIAGKDRRILFTYDRFAGVESLPQPGLSMCTPRLASDTRNKMDFRKSSAEARAPWRRMDAAAFC